MSRWTGLLACASVSLWLLIGPRAVLASDHAAAASIPIHPPVRLFVEYQNGGTTPGGSWQTGPWRLDPPANRLSVDLDLSLEPSAIGFRPGPIIVFWAISVEETNLALHERETWLTGPIETATLATCPESASPCSVRLTLGAPLEPLLNAAGGTMEVAASRLNLTVVRTFEDGALVQVLVPGPAEAAVVASLDRVRPMRGRFLPNGLLARAAASGSEPEVRPRADQEGGPFDYLAAVDGAVKDRRMATASGPDPWVPVHISIDTDEQCQGYILALIDEAGDRASIVSLGPDAVEADARVGRGVSWKLEIDVDQHQLAEFAAIDDAYLAAGKLSCVEGFPSDVRVVRIGPARAAPDASWPSVAVAAGIMGFGLLVVIVVGRRLRARPD